MEKTRLEFLQDTVNAEPANTFARYGLAMELQGAGRDAEAWQHFEQLLSHHPEYSAAYFHAGMLLVKMGRREQATQTLQKGIEVTGRQGNHHAQSELQAALDDLVSDS